jgi:hypothetical protein
MDSSTGPAVRVFVAPLREWTGLARWVAVLLGAGFCAAVGIGIGTHRQPFFLIADADKYLRLAAMGAVGVMQPFTSRQLAVLLARWIAKALGAPVEMGFLVEGFAGVAGTMLMSYWLLARTASPRWMLLAVAVLPAWVTQVQNLAYPDVLYATLLAAVFVLLAKERVFAAALMMFPLMLTRESTSLTLVCFLVAGWGMTRWRDRVAAVVATLVGSAVVGHLAKGSLPNAEGLPPAIYMFAKVPWNFLRNVVGILPWSNANTDLCQVPVWSFPFHYHRVQALGVCGFDTMQQLVELQVTLTNFGLLPLLVAVLWWRHRRWAGRSFLLRFSLLYGGASFVLSPLIGAGFVHLVGYAWPLFVVALPLLWQEFTSQPPVGRRAMAAVGFCVVHVAVCAVSYWPPLLAGIWVELGLWVVAVGLLQVWWPKRLDVVAERGVGAVGEPA